MRLNEQLKTISSKEDLDRVTDQFISNIDEYLLSYSKFTNVIEEILEETRNSPKAQELEQQKLSIWKEVQFNSGKV